ncbi:MAG TPA: Crp/Fnr family transcriptional regulator [Gammaproteobacteria bacterium]
MKNSAGHFASLEKTLAAIAPLPRGELDFLHCHARPVSYSAGATLVDASELPDRCWFLAKGFLRFFYVTESGREYNKAFSRPGEIVVPLTAMRTGSPNGFVIAAITAVETLAIPAAILPALFERHPAWERIGRILAEQMAMRKEMRERELLMDSALTRFRRFSERYPELVEWLPQRQIASYIGVTEQALSRLLRGSGGS